MQGRYGRSKWSETIGSVRNKRGAAVQCNRSVQPNSEARRLSTMQLHPPPHHPKTKTHQQQSGDPVTNNTFRGVSPGGSIVRETDWPHPGLFLTCPFTSAEHHYPLFLIGFSNTNFDPIEDQGMAKSCFRVCGESMTNMLRMDKPNLQAVRNWAHTWNIGHLDTRTGAGKYSETDRWTCGHMNGRRAKRQPEKQREEG